MWASFNRFEIQMTKNQAYSVSHPGQCDNDVLILLNDPKIKRQLKRISDTDLQSELKEYGAWNKEELQDRQANEMHIIWIAGCNIKDDIYEKESTK